MKSNKEIVYTRDYYLGSRSSLLDLMHERPLRAFVKLSLYSLNRWIYKISPVLYEKISNKSIVKAGAYARKILNRISDNYSFVGPYFEIQIGNRTRPSKIISAEETITSKVLSVSAGEMLCFGIAPILNDAAGPDLQKWSLNAKISTIEGSLVDSIDVTFPYGGRTNCFAYYRGDGWIDIKIDLTKYNINECKVSISCKSESISNRSSGKEIYSLSTPILRKHKKPAKKVILLSIESLSDLELLQDKYGFGELKSFKELSKHSTSYPKVYTTTDSTLSCIASMLTGLLPSQHGIGNYANAADGFNCDSLNENLVTLPEQFKNEGYTTIFGGTQVRLSSKNGWARGFDDYYHVFEKWSPFAPQIQWLIRTLEEYKDTDTFIMQHIDLLHDPLISFNENDSPRFHNIDVLSSSSEDNIKQLYFEQLRKLDAQLGQLLSYLKNNNLFEDCALIVTGDHGCGINWVKHSGNSLYEERLRVPLFVKYPQWSSRRVDAKAITNSSSEIHRVCHAILGKELPEYLLNLPQFKTALSHCAFSEAIMNPKRAIKKHSMALMHSDHKYICWNEIDWSKSMLEKRVRDEFTTINEQNVNGESLTNDSKSNDYRTLAYQVIEENLKFHSNYSPTKY